MSSPIQNSAPSKNYGGEEFPEDGEFPEDYYNDMPEGEVDVYWTDEEGEEVGSGGAPLSRESLVAQIQDLLNQDISDAQERKLERLLSKVQAAGQNRDKLGALECELYTVVDEIYGTPEAEGVEGEAAAEGDPAEGEGDGTLESSLKNLRDKITADTNLDDKTRQQLLDEVAHLEKTAELNGEDPLFQDQICADIEALQENYLKAAMNPSSVNDLAEKLGMEPSDLEALFQSHGLDPNNLPNPPDANVAALLNDPTLPSQLSTLNGNVKAARDDITNAGKDLSSVMQAYNQSAAVTDTSDPKMAVPDEAKDLYELHEHNPDSEQIKNYNNSLIKSAEEVASILSAMYGTAVQAVTDPAQAGCINFGGTVLNILPNSSSGSISFSSDLSIDYPKIDLVTLEIDAEGDEDSLTALPAWMLKVDYPTHNFDGDRPGSAKPDGNS